MLAGRIIAAIDRAFGAAPQINAETAIDLVLGADALGHMCRPIYLFGLLSR
jgi:hypothetical protein